MSYSGGRRAETYLNPVYPSSFPDPYVLKVRDEYFAYCTGLAPDGNVFSVLRSSNLVSWLEIGSALNPLDSSPPHYWAPEVTYDNGKFYLYYSVGNETLMEIRVAVSDRPDGGFVDAGKRLTTEEFAIDPHVFIDGDGTRYMFYATDFLTHTHIGTGTVVDRMVDWYTLEGNPRPVTRAKYDWQVYDPRRQEKGGVRWHTVEGPAVVKRKNVYYEMFSGGNWKNTTYGVSFASSDNLSGSNEWLQFSDGENVLPILRTIPETVIGPGHNSIVRGPNGRELFCVYHRWVGDHRVMAIDRMDFAGTRIFVAGASHTPQPAPFKPKIRESFAGSQLADGLAASGAWRFGESGAVSDPDGGCELHVSKVPESFLLEMDWMLTTSLGASFGISLATNDSGALKAVFDRDTNAVRIVVGEREAREVRLPNEFNFLATHRLRIEADGRRVSLRLDELSLDTTYLEHAVTQVTIFSERESFCIASLRLTEGFEELFEHHDPLEENGWRFDIDGSYRVEAGELILDLPAAYSITRGSMHRDVEFAVNFRTLEDSLGGEFGLRLAADNGKVFRLTVNCETRAVEAVAPDARVDTPLTEGVNLSQHHQLRIIKKGTLARCYFDDACLGEFPLVESSVSSAVYCIGVPIAVEMIRLTAI